MFRINSRKFKKHVEDGKDKESLEEKHETNDRKMEETGSKEKDEHLETNVAKNNQRKEEKAEDEFVKQPQIALKHDKAKTDLKYAKLKIKKENEILRSKNEEKEENVEKEEKHEENVEKEEKHEENVIEKEKKHEENVEKEEKHEENVEKEEKHKSKENGNILIQK